MIFVGARFVDESWNKISSFSPPNTNCHLPILSPKTSPSLQSPSILMQYNDIFIVCQVQSRSNAFRSNSYFEKKIIEISYVRNKEISHDNFWPNSSHLRCPKYLPNTVAWNPSEALMDLILWNENELVLNWYQRIRGDDSKLWYKLKHWNLLQGWNQWKQICCSFRSHITSS